MPKFQKYSDIITNEDTTSIIILNDTINKTNNIIKNDLLSLLLNVENKSIEEMKIDLNEIKKLNINNDEINNLINEIENKISSASSCNTMIEKKQTDTIIKIKKKKINLPIKEKNIQKSLQEQVDSGRLNYIVDDTMEVGKSYIIEVYISKNLSNKYEITPKILTYKNKEKNVVDTIIRVTSEMEIKIIDPTGECFRIIPISDEIQILENKEITKWKWNIIPLKDGENDLDIVVDVILGNAHKSYNVYEGRIHVYMKYKIWIKIGNFITNNLELIGGSIILPSFIWLFTSYILPLFRKRKRK